MTLQKTKIESQLVNVDEIAAMMGVCRGTIYKLLREGQFPQPTHRLGRRIVRWNRLTVQEFLNTGTLPANK